MELNPTHLLLPLPHFLHRPLSHLPKVVQILSEINKVGKFHLLLEAEINHQVELAEEEEGEGEEENS